MEILSTSKFKATCLAVLDEVKTQKKRLLIVHRGEPVAEVVPFDHEKKDPPLKDTVT